jgi:hypothetical protein
VAERDEGREVAVRAQLGLPAPYRKPSNNRLLLLEIQKVFTAKYI